MSKLRADLYMIAGMALLSYSVTFEGVPGIIIGINSIFMVLSSVIIYSITSRDSDETS